MIDIMMLDQSWVLHKLYSYQKRNTKNIPIYNQYNLLHQDNIHQHNQYMQQNQSTKDIQLHNFYRSIHLTKSLPHKQYPYNQAIHNQHCFYKSNIHSNYKFHNDYHILFHKICILPFPEIHCFHNWYMLSYLHRFCILRYRKHRF